jgi:hypothetical protein
MITISIEIHFTTLYMAVVGTRTEPLGEGAQAGKGESEERRVPNLVPRACDHREGT